MENKSLNSTGRTITLFALFAQNYIFGLRYTGKNVIKVKYLYGNLIDLNNGTAIYKVKMKKIVLEHK